MTYTRRSFMPLSLALLATACTTTPGSKTQTLNVSLITQDLMLLNSAVAAFGPMLPPSESSAAQTVAHAAQLITADLQQFKQTPQTTTAQEALQAGVMAANVVIGLFPGGGTAVTIAKAVLGLEPEIAALLGLSGAPAVDALPVAQAKAVLYGLPNVN